MSRKIGVLGLSGVGKSTLIGRIQEVMPVLHLQASGLIKAEQSYRAQNADTSEALRLGAVIDNQALMIVAFQREAARTKLPIIFDGHSVIDGSDGLIEIPSTVFRELGLDAIFFLAADPRLISERRLADRERQRPFRDVDTLRDYQKIAEAAARRIAAEMDRQFILIADGQIDLLSNILVGTN